MAVRIGRRILFGAITVFGVILLTFVLQYVIPGDPARSIAGPRASADVLAEIRKQLGLDQSLIVQLGRYLGAVFTGNLGYSYSFDQPVAQVIFERLPATAWLALVAFAIEVLLGALWGAWEALRGKRSVLLTTVNVGLLSMPTFALGYLLLLLFGYVVHWAPIEGGAGWPQVLLPALTLGVLGAPYYATAVRDGMITSLGSPYLRTAVSKGLGRSVILRRHVIRNVTAPIVTLAGMDIALFLSGVVFVEQIFAWPGLGELQVTAFQNVDRPLLTGTVIVAAVAVVLFGILADGVRALVDPRVRTGE
jgi:ABC-type dipeptide/oligopeptide/nickel transport system permease component